MSEGLFRLLSLEEEDGAVSEVEVDEVLGLCEGKCLVSVIWSIPDQRAFTEVSNRGLQHCWTYHV